MSGPYDTKKVEVPSGTWEDQDVAFQYFFGTEPKTFGAWGEKRERERQGAMGGGKGPPSSSTASAHLATPRTSLDAKLRRMGFLPRPLRSD